MPKPSPLPVAVEQERPGEQVPVSWSGPGMELRDPVISDSDVVAFLDGARGQRAHRSDPGTSRTLSYHLPSVFPSGYLLSVTVLPAAVMIEWMSWVSVKIKGMSRKSGIFLTQRCSDSWREV